jgi:hypothetical protein
MGGHYHAEGNKKFIQSFVWKIPKDEIVLEI